jgi:hypothetical protein
MQRIHTAQHGRQETQMCHKIAGMEKRFGTGRPKHALPSAHISKLSLKQSY